MGSDLLEDAAAANEPSVTEDLSGEDAGEGGRRRRLAAIAGIVLVAGAVAVVVALSSGSPSHGPPGTGMPAGETTAMVTRRTLTESATLDGTLGYSGSQELYDRLAEAGTFTWLPEVGAVIARGGTLFRINNLPVALMYGPVPAYRTLKEGVSDGPDVTELNGNLIDLGFDPYGTISDSEEFSEATAAAVRRWQKAEGLQQTGAVELGRVIFAPGAQRVTKLHVSLGQDPPGSSGSGNEGPGSEEPPSSEKQPHEKEAPQAPKEKAASKGSGSRKKHKPSGSEKTPGKGHGAEGGSKEPAHGHQSPEESSKAPSSKSSSPGAGEHPSGKASEGAAGTPVLSTTSTQQIVTLQVKADQQQLAHLGESAPVTLPGASVVNGHITSVGTVASEASESEKGGGGGEKGAGQGSGSGEAATIAVTIVLDHRVAHLDAAPVSVELVKESRRGVLVVPATALIAAAGGGYAVQTLEAGRRADLAVTPGMFANGYVQVEGAGIHEGLAVIESL